MALKPIEILINAKDNASSVFSRLQTKVAAVGVAIAGYFGIRAFSGAVEGAADLEQAMSRVQAATGASADQMAALRTAAEQAGANSIFTSTDAANALETLAKAGLDANDSIAALPAVVSLAQAADIGLAESSEFVTKAVMGMGLAFEDAGRVADVLAKGANATNTSVTGLAQALSYAAPVANSLNLSLEDTVAIVGKFADAGIDASRAGTALNSILSQFSNPASTFRKELAAAGITTGNFNTALRQLAESGPRGQKAVLAVGQEAGPALRALLNQGIGSLDELREKLNGAAGSAAETARVMQDNLRGSMTSLASVWDTVTKTLGTPVLPVLKQAVDQLATALRGAVSDGTVAAFGEAIAKGFKAAIEWVRTFVSEVDFKAIAADIRAAADSVGSTFDSIGSKATTAGNSVKLAWGAMKAGANAVMSIIYGVGAAASAMASAWLSAVAKIQEASAKITFGDVSERFAQAAKEVSISAGGMAAAADALANKSKDAFNDMADSASDVRDAWSDLSGEVGEKATSAANAASSAYGKVAAAVSKAADVVEKSISPAAKKAEADRAAAESVKALRAEYQELIASGDLEAAAVKYEEINKALGKTPGAANAAAAAAQDAADQVNAAFERLGVTSTSSLKQAAEAAQRDYEIIKRSGTSTAADIAAAFQVYAQKAIDANGGIASEAIKAEASMLGLSSASGKAGDSIVDAMTSGAAAVGVLTNSLQHAQQEVAELDGYLERLEQRNASVKSSLKTDAQGFSADANGNRIAMGSELGSLTGIAAFLKQAGVDDDSLARKIALEFSDGKGNIPYFSNPGQMKYGGDTLSMALLKAAEKVTFSGASVGGGGASVGKTSIPTQKRDVNVNLNLNGNSYGSVSTDDAGAAAIQGLMAELERAQGRAL